MAERGQYFEVEAVKMADCCRLPPTEFRTKAILQSDSGAGSYDSFGQETNSWASGTTLYVKIETLTGQELEQARQLYAKATHRVITRWRSGVTSRKRLLVGTRVLNIGFVDDINPWMDIRMLCSEDAPTA